MDFIAKNYKPFLLSLLSAVLIVISFPLPGMYLFAWISLIPILYVMSTESYWRGVSFAFFTGVLSNIGLFYWIFVAIQDYKKIPVYAAIAVIVLSFYVAIYSFGIWSLLLCGIGKKLSPLIYALFAASIWVVMEISRAHFATAFPWALFGYSQWKFLTIIQISEYTGVYGVSFLIVLFNAGILKSLQEKKWDSFLKVSGILFTISVLGFFLIQNNSLKYYDGPTLKTVSIQANIPQKKKWDPNRRAEIKKTFAGLVKKASNENPDLIVWPESAVTRFIPADNDALEWVSGLIKGTSSYHLIGAPFREPTKKLIFHNSTFLFNREASIIEKHKKIHLVPFGEFVPFRRMFPSLTVLNVLGNYTPGHKPTILPLELEKSGSDRVLINLGATICSENFFGHIMRGFTLNGANILINQSNDAWFLTTAAPYEHFQMNVFRAIENRRTILSAGNTGVTGIVEPSGVVQMTIPVFEELNMVSNLVPGKKITFYVKYGDIFAIICLLFIIGVIFHKKFTIFAQLFHK